MYTPSTMMTTAPEDGSEGFSVIDRHSNFDGAFIAKRDLRIEGEVRGSISCSGTLFIAQGAIVNAEVEAENITVAGDISGEIVCRGRLQVMPSGRLRGKVATKALIINEGAFYEGEMEMVAENRVAPGAPAPRHRKTRLRRRQVPTRRSPDRKTCVPAAAPRFPPTADRRFATQRRNNPRRPASRRR